MKKLTVRGFAIVGYFAEYWELMVASLRLSDSVAELRMIFPAENRGPRGGAAHWGVAAAPADNWQWVICWGFR